MTDGISEKLKGPKLVPEQIVGKQEEQVVGKREEQVVGKQEEQVVGKQEIK